MHYGVTLLIAMLACQSEHASSVAVSDARRAPIGLVGEWVRLAPKAFAGDTLTLREDSTASGVMPWRNGRLARVKRWKVAFSSKDPVASRADWRGGHTDGGDRECFGQHTQGCVSLPVLCVGAGQEYECEAFQYTAPDSLALSSGSRFVRAKPTSRS